MNRPNIFVNLNISCKLKLNVVAGAVIAERASSQLGLRSLVIDKREHIGGNCYDYVDQHGIR